MVGRQTRSPGPDAARRRHSAAASCTNRRLLNHICSFLASNLFPFFFSTQTCQLCLLPLSLPPIILSRTFFLGSVLLSGSALKYVGQAKPCSRLHRTLSASQFLHKLLQANSPAGVFCVGDEGGGVKDAALWESTEPRLTYNHSPAPGAFLSVQSNVFSWLFKKGNEGM